MIEATIRIALQNFPLTSLVLGFVVAAVAILRAPHPTSGALVAEKLLAWHVFFVIGVGNLYNFVLHAFFGEMVARFIGWADSPFQFEVAVASLGFSAVGFVATFRSFDMRLAAILGPSLFLLGAAGGHAYQMVAAHNFAPGNAGTVFYTDIFLPLIGACLLWLWHRMAGRVAMPA